MTYSIGEVSEMFGLPASTIRFYDRQGLLSDIKRSNGGIRVFSDIELDTLQVIECLKATNMRVKDIKQFLDWCSEGDKTLHKRREMFNQRREIVKQQIVELNKTLEMLEYKCWYYETACKAGTEHAPQHTPAKDLSEVVRRGKEALEKHISE